MALKTLYFYFCKFIKKKIETIFVKNFARNYEKKIILGTSDAWSTSHLSQRTSKPAYYIVHCRILGIFFIPYMYYRYTKDNFFPQTWQSFLCLVSFSNCMFSFPDSRRRLSISGAGPRQLPKLRLRKSTHGAHPFCPSLLCTNQWR